MSSNTKRTETKRAARQRNKGRKRKKSLEKKGTTQSENELFGGRQQ